MAAQTFTVDFSKPLVCQVGHLGEAYHEWVHQPIVSKESPRFFENDLLELLTLTRWWIIPFMWLPIVGWCFWRSILLGCTAPQMLLLSAFGISAFTLLEYSLHRLFHAKTKTYWGNTVHYLLHGCHHKHPLDGRRFFLPPSATAILLFPFWKLAELIATPATAPGLFGGGLLGYVIYDLTHYFLHHGKPTSRILKYVKAHHLNHHFRVKNKGFGITSPFWDSVFRTQHPPAM